MKTITPFLWYDGRVDEAIRLYLSVFANAKILAINGDDTDRVDGPVHSARLSLDDQEMLLFDGGPAFEFTPAISFMVRCRSQADVDRIWAALTDGGEPGRCGWLKDPFGVSWQIVPDALMEMLGADDEAAAGRARDAMLAMGKLDVAALQRAFAGPTRPPS